MSHPENPHMGPRLELVTTNHHSVFGDLDIGLFVWGASSSDHASGEGEVVTGTVRDTLVAFPLLRWRVPSAIPDEYVAAVVRALSAVRVVDGALPLTLEPAAGWSFSVDGARLTVHRKGPELLPLAGFEWFKIEERLRYFLNLTGTLGVTVIRNDDVWSSSITRGGEASREAMHDGNLTRRSYASLVSFADDWQAVFLGNPSLFSDSRDIPDDHFYAYQSTPNCVKIPKRLGRAAECIGCGRQGSVTKEHCTPRWLAKDQGCEPVVASVLCEECNNLLGIAVEQPMASAFRNGAVDVSSYAFSLWAVKTALTLSAASDVRLEPQWGRAIMKRQIPRGFRVFASGDVRTPEPGYWFAVTHFSAPRHSEGSFLFSFVSAPIAFVVLKSREPVCVDWPFRQVWPAPRGAAEEDGGRQNTRLDMPDLHASLLEGLTGNPVRFTDSSSSLG